MSDKLTNDELKKRLDAANVQYPSDAVKADLVKLCEDNSVNTDVDAEGNVEFDDVGAVAVQDTDVVDGVNVDPADDVPAHLNGNAAAHFPAMVPGAMGPGSLGGAFVESGAVLNTGGPGGAARKALDEQILDAAREGGTFGNAVPGYGGAVLESGAAVNTGGGVDLHGNLVAVDDGVPRSDLRDAGGEPASNPRGSHDPKSPEWDGVPRADLSSLTADNAREVHRQVQVARGIGTADFSPVSEQALGVGGSLFDGTAISESPDSAGALVKPEREGGVVEPARPEVQS